MMDGYGMAGFGFGGIFMLVWWGIIILGIVMLVKWVLTSLGAGGGRSGSDKALEILKERYARGEIDEQEFEKKKQELAR